MLEAWVTVEAALAVDFAAAVVQDPRRAIIAPHPVAEAMVAEQNGKVVRPAALRQGEPAADVVQVAEDWGAETARLEALLLAAMRSAGGPRR